MGPHPRGKRGSPNSPSPAPGPLGGQWGAPGAALTVRGTMPAPGPRSGRPPYPTRPGVSAHPPRAGPGPLWLPGSSQYSPARCRAARAAGVREGGEGCPRGPATRPGGGGQRGGSPYLSLCLAAPCRRGGCCCGCGWAWPLVSLSRWERSGSAATATIKQAMASPSRTRSHTHSSSSSSPLSLTPPPLSLAPPTSAPLPLHTSGGRGPRGGHWGPGETLPPPHPLLNPAPPRDGRKGGEGCEFFSQVVRGPGSWAGEGKPFRDGGAGSDWNCTEWRGHERKFFPIRAFGKGLGANW